MMSRISKRFARVEAQGAFGAQGTVNDLADPIAVMVRITDAVDVTRVIEEAFTALPHGGAPAPGNIISELPITSYTGVTGNVLYRAATGIWTYDLSPQLYQDGKSYSISWRFEMTPGNLKVDHAPFVWNRPPTRARSDDRCLISDNWYDMLGVPQAQKAVHIELYQDNFNPAKRRDSAQVQTDVFGNWWVDLPRNALIRFIIGDNARQIIVPDEMSATLSVIPEVQPADVNKDRFGYPLP